MTLFEGIVPAILSIITKAALMATSLKIRLTAILRAIFFIRYLHPLSTKTIHNLNSDYLYFIGCVTAGGLR